MQAIVLGVVFFIIGIIIFMHVIEIAVRNGINSSIIGQSLEKKNGIIEDKKPSLDSDLDNDK
jgi:hypothetical protein